MTTNATPNTSATKLITPKGILSFPHLETAQAGPSGGAAKYSATIIFLAGTDLTPMLKAVQAAGDAKWPGKFAEMVRLKTVRLPFRTDWEAKGYPKDSTFINIRSAQKPGIVSATAGPDGKPEAIPADKIRTQMYAGAFVRASVSAFGYDQQGNKGVSFGLNNLQKLGEGDRLDGRVAAENEFDADLTAQPADLAALLS